MNRLICALACVALLQSCTAFDWQQCKGASGKIEDVRLSPETPSPGTTVTFSIDATVGTCLSQEILLLLKEPSIMRKYAA